MDAELLRRSPLDSLHRELGARCLPFAGWEMPIQYAGIMEEHRAVREAVGIFDISHMGELVASGPEVLPWLDRVLSNRASALAVGEGQYSLLLNEEGGIIDDLIVYRLSEEEVLLVVNASMEAEDFRWLSLQATTGVRLENRSALYAGMAVQGPRASALYEKTTGCQLPSRLGARAEESGVVCRTGYTGEDGFEWFCPVGEGAAWFERFLDKGKSLGIQPCGLGARDSLRLEVCYPLNGSDLSLERTPLEAGLGWAVSWEKGHFIGRERLAEQKALGPPERLVALRMTGKSPPPRSGYEVFSGEVRVGTLTSGTLSPSLGVGIAMAYLPTLEAKVGRPFEIEIRGRRFPAEVVKKPFYHRES